MIYSLNSPVAEPSRAGPKSREFSSPPIPLLGPIAQRLLWGARSAFEGGPRCRRSVLKPIGVLLLH